jgi:UDPglucose--hexose-1-phosphate uridylyltransferase
MSEKPTAAQNSRQLDTSIFRTDRLMNDGRTIRYYDHQNITRSAPDLRPAEDPAKIGELRLDPLVSEWIAFAAHRQHRAFLPPKELCPLCPTTSDLLTEIPDSNFEVVVFDNKNPSLSLTQGEWALPETRGPQTETTAAAGKCEVICFSDQHQGSFGSLSLDRILLVIKALRDRTQEISALPNIVQVFPFENRGEEVGVTIRHPHGQIYSYSYLTPRTEKMLNTARAYHAQTGRVLLDDVVAREIKDGVRITAQNEHWVAYVPFAARYPFEIHVAPRKSVADLTELTIDQINAFPEIAKTVLLQLDGVFNVEMPYMAAWHQAPVSVGRDVLRLHWQITCVRRAPGKLKYLAGSESAMGAFIMDLTPEQSAEQLKAVTVKL